MAKFAFRLQKVLEVRQREEERAKEIFQDAVLARQAREDELTALSRRRQSILAVPANGVEARLTLARMMEHLDDQEKSHRTVLAMLEREERTARDAWHARRQALETLVRMSEKAHEVWRLDQNRREQAALDEWSTLRSAA